MKHKKLIKRILLVSLSLFILISMVFLACYFYVQNTEFDSYSQKNLQDVPVSEYILVPGAQVLEDGPNLHLQDRLDTAIKLYKDKKGKKIIVSGGYEKKHGVYESDVMEKYLLAHGIKEADIINDKKGVSTYETIQRTSAYAHGKSVIICTQASYLPRTMYLAKNFNLKAVGVQSDIHEYTKYILIGNLREFLASTKAVFKGGLFKPITYDIETYPFDSKIEKH